MEKHLSPLLYALLGTALLLPREAEACTGITLTARDSARIVGRTIEWGTDELNSLYVIVPRGYRQQSYTPEGTRNGMSYTARYGYVGVSVVQKEFVTEGLNEAGLSAGLFYFPGYGEYEPYDGNRRSTTIGDLELVAWMLGNFATVDEAVEGIRQIHVAGIDPRASTAHWRIADRSGRQVVLEITGQVPRFYENTLGVLTNSPGFEWHLTNLNNYINLSSGTAQATRLGNAQLSSLSAGSGLLGLPGDITSPSRFVRAAFCQATAPQQPTARKCVLQCFEILNSFDIPIGLEFPVGKAPDLPSATQWTAVSDMTNGVFYFRTMYDSTIRSIDLNGIDFATTRYRAVPIDEGREMRIERIALTD